MADIHVNSTNGGTPTSPYSTWATAALTTGAAAAVAVAGDNVYVHPSHSESPAVSLTWTSTAINPVKVICGTPDTTSGITALQNTAIVAIAANSTNLAWQGLGVYVHGIVFKITGSTGTATLRLNQTQLGIWAFNDCELHMSGTSANSLIGIGYDVKADSITTFTGCRFKYGATGQVIRLMGHVTGVNCSVMSGTTPTQMFTLGYSTNDAPSRIEFDGFDFSVLSSTVKLGGAAKVSLNRFRNLKVPSGWGTPSNVPFTAEVITSAQVEILNYGSGDTNYQYWIESKTGRSMSESTIKVNNATASGNDTATYSRRMQSLTNVAYPHAVFRGPPLCKYVVANGLAKDVFVSVAYDGASPFTNKEFWLEVSYMGNSGFPLSIITSTSPSYLVGSSSLPTSAVPWTGFTDGVTTGPNGSSNWNIGYVVKSGITIQESGWLIAVPCFAVAAKTIFINDALETVDIP